MKQISMSFVQYLISVGKEVEEGLTPNKRHTSPGSKCTTCDTLAELFTSDGAVARHRQKDLVSGLHVFVLLLLSKQYRTGLTSVTRLRPRVRL